MDLLNNYNTLSYQTYIPENCNLTVSMGSFHANVELACPMATTLLVGLTASTEFRSLAILLGESLVVQLAHRTAKISPSIMNILPLFTSLKGEVVDEDPFEHAFQRHASATFSISSKSAEKVREHIASTKELFSSRKSYYSLLFNNCVVFTQSVYEKAGLQGHFIDQLNDVPWGIGSLYAKISSILPKLM
jgi:hypothetical protein